MRRRLALLQMLRTASWSQLEPDGASSFLKWTKPVLLLQEPEFTVYTDRTKSCRDYVWYTGDNLNANSALNVSIRLAHVRSMQMPWHD